MKKLLCVFFVLTAVSTFATKTVNFAVDSATGRMTQTGQFVAGSEHTVNFVLSSGAWYDAGVYRVTLKQDSQYLNDPYSIVAGDDVTVDGATLTLTIDLNVTELYTDIGTRPALWGMIDVRDAAGTYALQRRIQILNSVYRPTDTIPAGSLNEYWTIPETQAAIDAKPAGVNPVPDAIDGYNVLSTDTGQLKLDNKAGSEIVRQFSDYALLSSLATGDQILVLDATDGVLKRVTLQTLLDWMNGNLP